MKNLGQNRKFFFHIFKESRYEILYLTHMYHFQLKKRGRERGRKEGGKKIASIGNILKDLLLTCSLHNMIFFWKSLILSLLKFLLLWRYLFGCSWFLRIVFYIAYHWQPLTRHTRSEFWNIHLQVWEFFALSKYLISTSHFIQSTITTF